MEALREKYSEYHERDLLILQIEQLSKLNASLAALKEAPKAQTGDITKAKAMKEYGFGRTKLSKLLNSGHLTSFPNAGKSGVLLSRVELDGLKQGGII